MSLCVCTCSWKRVMATRWQTSRQTRPLTHMQTNPQVSGFLTHASTHSQLAARMCKKPDEVWQCVDLVTQQRGRVFETAPQREVVTGWENVWNEVLSAFPYNTIVYLLVSSHFVQIVFGLLKCSYNKFDLLLLSNAVCAKISQWVNVKSVFVQMSLQLALKSFLSC